MLWIVIAFFAGAYLGAIAIGAVIAWRDLHPGRGRRARSSRPPVEWDFGPRTQTQTRY